jgi:hypothetical protein
MESRRNLRGKPWARESAEPPATAKSSSVKIGALVARNSLEHNSNARGRFLGSDLKNLATSSSKGSDSESDSMSADGEWYLSATSRPKSICKKTIPKSHTSVFCVYCGLETPAISGGNQYADFAARVVVNVATLVQILWSSLW